MAATLVGGFAGSAAASPSGSPFGNGYDVLRGVDGGIEVKGWAIDPDTSASVTVRYSVDGVVRNLTADALRPDVEAAIPGYGPYHGFEAVLPASPGFHDVCVTFANIGAGADSSQGCRTVRVGGSPFGSGFDKAEDAGGAIRSKGWAIDPDTNNPVQVRISIDGKAQTVSAADARADVASAFPGYGQDHGWDVVIPASAGTREVCVTLLNTGVGQDLDLGCKSVSVAGSTTTTATSTTTTTTTTTSSSKPGSTNTGVPAGTSLQVHNGDLRIKTPGTVIDGMDIRGYVQIEADNVTIRNSIIRGGAAATTSRALVASWWGAKNFVIEDSTLVAANPSLRIDGLSGANWTGRRLNIYGVVDPVKVIGGNATLTDSWLHDTIHSDNDPNQSDGKTHDDAIQVVGGSNIVIRNNVLEDAHNAAIMISQGTAATHNVTIESNWLSDGACTVNVSQGGSGGGNQPIQGMRIANNRFGHGSHADRCPMRLPATSPIQVTGNTWITNGTAVKPNWF